MTVGDRRWGSRSHRAEQALGARSRSATRAFPPEGDGGGGGESFIGLSRGNAAIDRASGGAGTSALAWSPSMQRLAPEVSLRTSVLLRPPRGDNPRKPGRGGGGGGSDKCPWTPAPPARLWRRPNRRPWNSAPPARPPRHLRRPPLRPPWQRAGTSAPPARLWRSRSCGLCSPRALSQLRLRIPGCGARGLCNSGCGSRGASVPGGSGWRTRGAPDGRSRARRFPACGISCPGLCPPAAPACGARPDRRCKGACFVLHPHPTGPGSRGQGRGGACHPARGIGRLSRRDSG